MKIKLIAIGILFCNCAHNDFSGKVYDFDTNQPIQNVLVEVNNKKAQTDSVGCFNIEVNSNSSSILYLKKEGYEAKSVLRKPDSSKENKTRNIIYMFQKDSDLSSMH